MCHLDEISRAVTDQRLNLLKGIEGRKNEFATASSIAAPVSGSTTPPNDGVEEIPTAGGVFGRPPNTSLMPKRSMMRQLQNSSSADPAGGQILG